MAKEPHLPYRYLLNMKLSLTIFLILVCFYGAAQDTIQLQDPGDSFFRIRIILKL